MLHFNFYKNKIHIACKFSQIDGEVNSNDKGKYRHRLLRRQIEIHELEISKSNADLAATYIYV